MTKVPQRDEIWKHKKYGCLARVTYIDTSRGSIYFLDNSDKNVNVEYMESVFSLDWFKENFIFVGDGKPIDVLFEVQDER